MTETGKMYWKHFHLAVIGTAIKVALRTRTHTFLQTRTVLYTKRRQL
jgi:hypothetical protein